MHEIFSQYIQVIAMQEAKHPIISKSWNWNNPPSTSRTHTI